MVVENDGDAREAIRAALELEGVGAVLARGVREALALLDGPELPDLIVSDLSMPGGSGLDLIKLVREDRGLPIPFVIMTGSRAGDVPAAARCDVLQKPFDFADLMRAMNQAIQRGPDTSDGLPSGAGGQAAGCQSGGCKADSLPR